jgi:hypothetical protein
MSVCCECCQVEVSATGWSLLQRSPTECGVSECDRDASIMRRPRPPRSCRAIEKKKFTLEQDMKAQRGSRGIALLFL